MPLKVDQCCCGCTLRTGTILIAVYYIVGSFCILSLTTLGLHWVHHGYNSTTEVQNNSESTNNSESHLPDYVADASAMFTFFMLYSIASILLNVMLLIGAQREKPRLLYVWIVAHLVYLAVTVLGLLTSIFMTLHRNDERAGSFGSSLINFVLTFYFLVVVSSYYGQLKDRLNTAVPQAPPVVVCIDNSAPPPAYSELYPRCLNRNDVPRLKYEQFKRTFTM